MAQILIIVDPQNDFCEGGIVAIRESNQIFSNINSLKNSNKFDHVIITRDWHPADHISFARTHKKENYSAIVIEN